MSKKKVAIELDPCQWLELLIVFRTLNLDHPQLASVKETTEEIQQQFTAKVSIHTIDSAIEDLTIKKLLGDSP